MIAQIVQQPCVVPGLERIAALLDAIGTMLTFQFGALAAICVPLVYIGIVLARKWPDMEEIDDMTEEEKRP